MKEQGRVHDACKWCYSGVWGVLTRYLKLPAEPPKLPIKDQEQVVYLHPSEAYLAYQKFQFWILLLVVDILLSIGWAILFFMWPLAGILITPLALGVIILPDIFAYIAIHLKYDTTWYVLSEQSMRLRRGIWNIHETTISFDNIQNIHIHQGPLQRWFGFSNLLVETAGGGGGEQRKSIATHAHSGFLEGLSDAATIREQILARCSRCSGLGEHPTTTPSLNSAPQNGARFRPEHIGLLRSIRDLTTQLSKPMQ